jgi:hypothetical protein
MPGLNRTLSTTVLRQEGLKLNARACSFDRSAGCALGGRGGMQDALTCATQDRKSIAVSLTTHVIDIKPNRFLAKLMSPLVRLGLGKQT